MHRLSNSLASADIAHTLHPNINPRTHEEHGPLVIACGQGIGVFDDEGKETIEGQAGLRSVGAGFSEKRLTDAVRTEGLL